MSQMSISPISPSHSNYVTLNPEVPKYQNKKNQIRHFNDNKSFSDYGNPLITPCFFQNETPIKHSII